MIIILAISLFYNLYHLFNYFGRKVFDDLTSRFDSYTPNASPGMINTVFYSESTQKEADEFVEKINMVGVHMYANSKEGVETAVKN